MELLIVLQEDAATNTIVYYEVDGEKKKALAEVHQQFIDSGEYVEEDAPYKDPKYPIDTGKPRTFRSLLVETRKALTQPSASETTVQRDMVGLMINPPWPRGRVFFKKKHGFAKFVFLLAGLAAGLFLGPVLFGGSRRYRSRLEKR